MVSLVQAGSVFKMRMRLESGKERSVRDNRYIAVFMIGDVAVVSLFFIWREGGNIGAKSLTLLMDESRGFLGD